MSDVEDSHSDDNRNNYEEELTNALLFINEQYRQPRPDDETKPKRLKLHDTSHPLLIEDILHHLFSYFNIQELVKMGRVCKVWQFVSRQKIKFASTASFYLKLNRPHPYLGTIIRLIEISLIKNVLELTDKTVTRVNIIGSYSIEPVMSHAVCKILSDNCPNLTQLNLLCMYMSRSWCSNLGKCLPPNLKTLEIKECIDVADHTLGMILGNCKNLENLVLVNHHANAFQGLSIIENLKSGQLKKLSLTGCEVINVSYLSTILEMFKSSLRELILDWPVIDEYPMRINSDSKFNLLEMLSLDCYSAVVDDVKPRNLYFNLKLFLNAMPNLTTLKLDHCRFTANKECYFKLLPKCVPLLKELHILESCPKFRKNISLLSELTNLETLVLDGLFDMHHDFFNSEDESNDDYFRFQSSRGHFLPDQARDALITHLVDVIIKCPKLKTVICNGTRLNDDHVFTMISSMPSLRLLKMSNTSMVTGLFVSKCADLDRICPIKVATIDDKFNRDSFPVIPPFLKLSHTHKDFILASGYMVFDDRHNYL